MRRLYAGLYYNLRMRAWMEKEQALGLKVSEAFADATADRNSRSTVLFCVRPSSWLHRIADEFRASKHEAQT